MIAKVGALLVGRKTTGKPLIVGLTGIDTSGKSHMAEMLSKELTEKGHRVQLIHVDDFHRPRVERYQMHLPEPEQYYEFNFNFDLIASKLLIPIREDGRLATELTLLDLLADTFTLNRTYEVDESTIVIIEGVFLFRPGIRELIDVHIFLDISEETVYERAKLRDVPIYGVEFLEKYGRKYLPGQRAYLAKYPPSKYADIVIDNNDWRKPRLLDSDSERNHP